MHLNLMPIQFRIRLILRARLREWTKVWGLCLVGIAAACAFQMWQIQQRRAQLGVVEVHSQPVRRIRLQSDKLQQQLFRLLTEIERTESIQPKDLSLPLLGILSESVENTGGRIQIMRCTVQIAPRQPVAAAGSQTPSANAQRSSRNARETAARRNVGSATSLASIHGIATDHESLARFVVELRAYGIFEKVDLKSSSRIASVIDGGREFQLECRF